VAPYVEALDEFERQTIVVTDKWRARILSVFLGTLETTTEIQDIPHTTHIHATGKGRLEAQTHDQRHADENTKEAPEAHHPRPGERFGELSLRPNRHRREYRSSWRALSPSSEGPQIQNCRDGTQFDGR
jgi:hypothetical protein